MGLIDELAKEARPFRFDLRIVFSRLLHFEERIAREPG